MGNNAQESVKKLSVDRCVEEHLSLYQRHSAKR
jgi:hypothetical protein